MSKMLVVAAALVCLCTVALGAFAAHLLDGLLQGKQAGWYQTAVQYQFMHGLGMLACALLASQLGGGARLAGWLMLAGIVIFCGSLYVMALGGPRWFGAITPIGGLAFLAAWAVLALAAWRKI